MKRGWEEKTLPVRGRPNIIVGSNAHACVFKFAAYFDVDTRVVAVNAASRFVVDEHQLAKIVNQDTGTGSARTVRKRYPNDHSWCLSRAWQHLYRSF